MNVFVIDPDTTKCAQALDDLRLNKMIIETAQLLSTANYRAKQKQATPKWLSKAQLSEIRALYKEAKRLSKITGIQHHVDHIMPLNSSILCGLHVPWNLQILIFRDNIKKSNRVDGEAIAGRYDADLRNFGAPQSSVVGNNCPS